MSDSRQQRGVISPVAARVVHPYFCGVRGVDVVFNFADAACAVRKNMDCVARFLWRIFCATVVICDGWLNNNATRENRSKLLGMFMTVSYLSYGAGQFILLLGEERPINAFVVSAICMALCMLPICLTRLPEPQPPPRDTAEMRWRDAYRVAPVAFLGQFSFGVYTGATFLFISYLEDLEVAPGQRATLAAMFFGFGFLMQIPVGWLADRVRDRRDIIIGVGVLSAICAAALGLGDILPYTVLAILIMLLGFHFLHAFFR